MTKIQELIERINHGENAQTEFKAVFDSAEQVTRTIVALANQPQGGWLIFGVNRDGSIGGISNPDRVKSQIDTICQKECFPKLEPEIESIQTSEGVVLLVKIKGPHPPYHTLDNRFWIRRDDASTDLIPLDDLINVMLGRPRETVSYQINRLRVRYFKSLYDVDIPLKPLTIFIGPNGSGKSNFSHLLRLLKCAAFDPKVGEKYKNVAQELIWLGKEDGGERPDSFQVELLCTLPKDIVRYTLQVAPGNARGLVFVKENLSPFIVDEPDAPKSYIERRRRSVRVHTFSESTQGTGEQRHYSLEESHLALQYLGPLTDSPVLKAFQHFLGSWRLFDVNVQKARQSSRLRERAPGQVPPLDKDGANLSEFLYALQRLQKDDWNEIKWRLEAIDFVRDLDVRSAPGVTGPEVEVEYRLLEKAFDEPLSAESMSDGTIRFLAHLALLLGDHSAPLICLEEPDRGMHPALMKRLASVLRYIATLDDPKYSSQVFLTTHDPGLLNWFQPDLDKDYFQIVITEKDPRTGKSTFRVLRPSELAHWLDTFRLGELHERGILDDYGRGDRG